MANNWTYPDIYYKIHPHVLNVCNQWIKSGARLDEADLNAMTDHVCALALQSNPELKYFALNDDLRSMITGGGLFRDLVGIILIGELFRRRRRRRYW